MKTTLNKTAAISFLSARFKNALKAGAIGYFTQRPHRRRSGRCHPLIPQVAEPQTPRSAVVTGEFVVYADRMVQVYIADSLPDERAALRLLILDLKMNVIGEASDWATTLAAAPLTAMDMLLVDWSLLPENPLDGLTELRSACPNAIVIVLISHLDASEQAARAAGADDFISKGETPDRVTEHLIRAAGRIQARLALPDQPVHH